MKILRVTPALTLGLICLITIVRVGVILRDRGVAIPQEMAVGELFFTWLPTLLSLVVTLSYFVGSGSLLLGVASWRLAPSSLRAGLAQCVAGLCLIVSALSFSHPYAPIFDLSCALALGVIIARRVLQTNQGALIDVHSGGVQVSIGTLFRDTPLLSAAAALGWCGLFLVEAFTYTHRFVPRLISPDQFSDFVVYGLAIVILSASLVTLMLPLFGLVREVTRRVGASLGAHLETPDEDLNTASRVKWGLIYFLIPHFMALGVLWRLFRGAVGQEIDGLGLNLHLMTLLALIMIAISSAHLRCFEWVYVRTRCERRVFSSYLTALTALPLLLPLLGAQRLIRPLATRLEERYERERGGDDEETPQSLSGWRHTALLVSSALITLYPLIQATFPHIEDMTAAGGVIFGTLIFFISLFATWSLVSRWLGAPRRDTRALVALSALLVGSGAITLTRYPSQDLRVISDQYMKVFVGLFHRMHLSLTSPWNMGFEGPGEVAWAPYGDRHKRLEPHPSYPLLDPQETPIVIVIWDAGRPDRMQLYGHSRPTTPKLDALREDFFIFDEAISGGTATSIGTKTLFSGHYSTRYMLEREKVDMFWTQELLKHGYRDFILNVFGTDYNGISLDAFQRHLSPQYKGVGRYTFVDGDHSSQRKLEALQEQLRAQVKRGNHRFLLSMHLVDTHSPWRLNQEGPRFGESPHDRYDHNVARSDLITGELFAEMKRLGVWERSLVMVMADHGTGLGEHGLFAGFRPYQEQIKIPLLIKLPNHQGHGVVISEPVSLIDIGPTITHLFEEGTPNRFDGVSLLPLMLSQGERQLDRRYLMSLNAFNDSYAVIEDGRWKWILYRRDRYLQLFDLRRDPQELRNLSSLPAYQTRAHDFKEMMRSFLHRGRETYNAPYHYKPYDPERFSYW